ncbi:DUF4954 family protein [Treponema sp. C6A8]|uniref:DUF4954 family protein n=1 Tax=Treponema sp. C6A8 TaxID=1410609 RepID=UPI0004875967|nr:DUF4954 family protein [Treponema sp. C6A8]
MVNVEVIEKKHKYNIPSELLNGKRHLTANEISVLKANQNYNEDSSWKNFYVDEGEDGFDPSLITGCYFSGYIVLGKLRPVMIKFHDLNLEAGIRNSKLKDIITGDDFAIYDVKYFENYRIGNRVILFDVSEIYCTNHSKFGVGIIKKGDTEDRRMWIGVANENDGRRILPFESMITADAYLWSHYRDDKELLNRFVEMVDSGHSAELDSQGFIDDDCVIKQTNIIKDAKIGKCVYIKGGLKIKNITILSTPEEPSQIGEGVILVNGIMGYGTHVFYNAIAVRFVIGRNCNIKYGARLLNSVLGDNSTISCCEVLNNLIFPYHEQHHNSSFLIATTVMGQSNIAAGATIGSNHNSRSPDGEIFAKRGFWPGLCSDFKHNSRFASFVLVSKGSYQYELDIQYPFSLVCQGQNGDPTIHIIPAWWFIYDMFAITRNKNKFLGRDKRVVKVQNIETDPYAPDTMEEILYALDRIINLTADYLEKQGDSGILAIKDEKMVERRYQYAKDYLHKNPDAVFTLTDAICQKKFGATICKPVKAYRIYRQIVKYFATRTLLEYGKSLNSQSLTADIIERIRKLPLYTEWENVGGQIIPHQKVMELFDGIKNGSINNWESVHQFYNMCQCSYDQYKVRYSLYLLETLYSRGIEEFDSEIFDNIVQDVSSCAQVIYDSSVKSRKKDYTDYYRNMVYRSKEEMNAVIGPLEDNKFLISLKEDTKNFISDVKQLFVKL